MGEKLIVRDRTGVLVERADGLVQDGDTVVDGGGVRVPFHMMDGAGGRSVADGRSTGVYIRDADGAAGADTLKVAAAIIPEQFRPEDYAGLSAAEVRRKVVVAVLGAQAQDRSDDYIRAAWDTLAVRNTYTTPQVSTGDAARVADATPAARIVDGKHVPGPYRDHVDALVKRSGGYGRMRVPDGMVGDRLAGHLDGAADAAFESYLKRLDDAWKHPLNGAGGKV